MINDIIGKLPRPVPLLKPVCTRKHPRRDGACKRCTLKAVAVLKLLATFGTPPRRNPKEAKHQRPSLNPHTHHNHKLKHGKALEDGNRGKGRLYQRGPGDNLTEEMAYTVQRENKTLDRILPRVP